MGFFSRIVKGIAGALDVAAESINRALGLKTEKPAKAGPLPTVIDEEKPKKPPRPPSSGKKPTPAPSPPSAPSSPPGSPVKDREKLAAELGPVDSVEDVDRSIAEIELDQWIAFFDAHPDQVPENFTQQLRELAGDYGLEDELFTTTELDAPKGDTL